MPLPPGADDLMSGLSDSQRMNLKVLQNITSVNTAVNNLQDDLRELKSEFTIHDKLLVTGNGIPSLQERVRTLEAYIDNQKHWLRLIGGALVLQTITLFVSFMLYFARVVPLLDKLSKLP